MNSSANSYSLSPARDYEKISYPGGPHVSFLFLSTAGPTFSPLGTFDTNSVMNEGAQGGENPAVEKGKETPPGVRNYKTKDSALSQINT